MLKRPAVTLALAGALIGVSSRAALAQGAASISGSVVDSAGGVIPGAAVVVSNETGATFETLTNTEGVFNVPASPPAPTK